VRRKPSTKKEADVEETIGYEALFSPEEWAAIQSGDWSGVPDEWGSPNDESPSRVRVRVRVRRPR
jgi:hypothetical protein